MALRTADMLLVRFSFENMRVVLDGEGTGALRRRVASRPAYLIADFPPQHLVEEAFAERGNPGLVSQPQLPGGKAYTGPPATESNVAPPAPPVQASLSEHSRLVFAVGNATIRWSLDGLLAAMSTLPLSIAHTQPASGYGRSRSTSPVPSAGRALASSRCSASW